MLRLVLSCSEPGCDHEMSSLNCNEGRLLLKAFDRGWELSPDLCPECYAKSKVRPVVAEAVTDCEKPPLDQAKIAKLLGSDAYLEARAADWQVF